MDIIKDCLRPSITGDSRQELVPYMDKIQDTLSRQGYITIRQYHKIVHCYVGFGVNIDNFGWTNNMKQPIKIIYTGLCYKIKIPEPVMIINK